MTVVPTTILDILKGASDMMGKDTNRRQLMMAAGMLIGAHGLCKTQDEFEGWSRAACNLLYLFGKDEEWS